MAYQTFVTPLCRDGPILVVGDALYACVPPRAGTPSPYGALAFGTGMPLALSPLGTLDDLVAAHLEASADALFAIKQQFIHENVKADLHTAGQRDREVGERKLFKFILEELIPYMSGNVEDIGTLIGEEIQREHLAPQQGAKTVDPAELARTVEEAKRALLKDIGDHARYAGHTPVSYLLSFIGQEPAILTPQGVWTLQKQRQQQRQGETQDPKRQASIALAGKARPFTLTPAALTAESLERDMLGFIEHYAKREAIEEFGAYITDIQRTRLESMQDMDKVMQLREFSKGDVGFIRKGDNLYVTHTIPPFAMLDPRPSKKEICYAWPQMRIAMHIYLYDGRISLEEPHLVDALHIPFVDNGSGWRHLCGGHVPSRDRNRSDTEWVAKALDDAKNLVMNGLTPHSIRRHDGDRTNGGTYFGVPLDRILAPYEMTIAQAKKKGLPITNRWEWDRD